MRSPSTWRSEWAWWDGRTVRTWPTALEAMEAVDAERGGVPNG